MGGTPSWAATPANRVMLSLLGATEAACGITSILAAGRSGMWWRKRRHFCLYLVWSGVGGFLSQAWEDCEPEESRKPVREAPSSSGLQMEACYREGLREAEVWSLALRGLGGAQGSSMPPAASPSCCWPTSCLDVRPSAQRPPPPPLPTTASKQDHGVVAGVTSDAPQVSSPGPADSCPVRKAYFWGSGFLSGRPLCSHAPSSSSMAT